MSQEEITFKELEQEMTEELKKREWGILLLQKMIL